MNEGRLQTGGTLFFDYESLKFSLNHFAGVTVNDLTEPVPNQCPLARRVAFDVPQA